jgi:hypothetical protein
LVYKMGEKCVTTHSESYLKILFPDSQYLDDPEDLAPEQEHRLTGRQVGYNGSVFDAFFDGSGDPVGNIVGSFLAGRVTLAVIVRLSQDHINDKTFKIIIFGPMWYA